MDWPLLTDFLYTENEYVFFSKITNSSDTDIILPHQYKHLSVNCNVCAFGKPDLNPRTKFACRFTSIQMRSKSTEMIKSQETQSNTYICTTAS